MTVNCNWNHLQRGNKRQTFIVVLQKTFIQVAQAVRLFKELPIAAFLGSIIFFARLSDARLP